MIIDDSTLIRFINNDLSKSEKNKIQLLINNNPKIKYRVQGLINFRSMLKDESKANKKIKMPETLYEKISSEKNIKKSYVSNNFYKIAAGILGFVSIGWLITMPNKAYLSQKSYLPNKYHSSKIYYSKSERNQFLSKYDNCKAVKQKTFDENNKEVFPVICKID
tara:strand:- start:103 stop:594 length:492 start_codon:yes stop_codon:yes gene_type:complete